MVPLAQPQPVDENQRRSAWLLFSHSPAGKQRRATSIVILPYRFQLSNARPDAAPDIQLLKNHTLGGTGQILDVRKLAAMLQS
jgi:hypothetical protein